MDVYCHFNQSFNHYHGGQFYWSDETVIAGENNTSAACNLKADHNSAAHPVICEGRHVDHIWKTLL